jgi:hypothetical protein
MYIMIPNVAEKKYSDFGGGKQIICFRVFVI